jgi:hypothetical protein
VLFHFAQIDVALQEVVVDARLDAHFLRRRLERPLGGGLMPSHEQEKSGRVSVNSVR